MMKTKKSPSILITTGDVDGVGLEVAVSALIKLKGKLAARPVLFASPDGFKFESERLAAHLKVHTYSSLQDALHIPSKGKSVFVVLDKRAPAFWVKEAALQCLKSPKEFALVTGPLSKTGIQSAGFSAIGHTEMLKELSQKKYLFQTYLGKELNILLVTDHIPLERVSQTLKDKSLFKSAVAEALRISKDLKRKGPVVCLGLDPHSGEAGVIGHQDREIQTWLQEISPGNGRKLIGPLPSDSAFESTFRKSVGFYIALYHDQGLIPFKTLHGFDRGVHLTLGLPFVRTSVDHGTAKALFRKRRANPGSMKDAIETAIKLVEKIR